MLPDYVQASVNMKGVSFKWNNWADVLEPNAGTSVWATYTDQYYKGKAAVISRKLGKGTVTFVGPDSDDAELEKAVLKQVYARAGVSTKNLPLGVVVQWRNGFWVAVNYSDKPYELNIPASAKIRFGTKNLPTAGVTVWQE
jgi:beta-galactosidase